MNFKFTFKFRRLLKYKYFICLLIAFGFNSLLYGSVKKSSFEGPPVFSSTNYSYNITETAALGSIVGTVSATDPDGGSLVYSIKLGNTNSALSINSVTGTISVVKTLNHHTQARYDLTVKVSDPGDLSSEALVTINVQEGSAVPVFDSITWGSAANQPYRVSELQGEVVKGKLYTFGGFDSEKTGYTPTSRAYKYDPAVNTWASIAPMPPMNGTNYGGVTHAGFTTDGTDIFFAGGYTSNSGGTGQIFGTKEAWKYIVAENRYVRLPDLPIAIAAGQLEYLTGKLHHISGTNSSRTVDLGDHYVLDLDSLSAGWKKLAPLPNPRQHAGSVVYEGKIYFIGGQRGHDSKLVTQRDVHVYDQVTNTWTKLADLPVPAGSNGRGHISSAAIVIGKYILVIGGELVHSTGTTDMVSAYTAATNTWNNLTHLPLPRRSGVAANLNGLVYYSGGSNSRVTFKGTPFQQAGPILAVQNFTLINADNDQPMQTLKNGDTLNLANLATTNLNVVANTNPAQVGSVLFNLAGPQPNNVTDNQAPYTLFGDDGNGDYYPWTPSLGTYTLTATPYSSTGATGTSGSAQTITFTVINIVSQYVTLAAQADAFVRDGTYSNTNYGNDTSLIAKSSSSGFSRSAYLKFALPAISNITSAKLRLYGGNTEDNTGLNILAYGVNNDSWTENNITWSNAPTALTATLSSVTVNNQKKYYEFDITGFVQAQSASDNVVSILIKEQPNMSKLIKFNSKENMLNQPQLFISYGSSSRQINADNQVSDSQLLSPVTATTLASGMFNGMIKAKVYPNPMHKTFTVEFEKDNTGDYEPELIDQAGRRYKLGKFQLKPGINSVRFNISKLLLKAGIYFLRIQEETGKTAIAILQVN